MVQEQLAKRVAEQESEMRTLSGDCILLFLFIHFMVGTISYYCRAIKSSKPQTLHPKTLTPNPNTGCAMTDDAKSSCQSVCHCSSHACLVLLDQMCHGCVADNEQVSLTHDNELTTPGGKEAIFI
jgi:hypothetical protein